MLVRYPRVPLHLELHQRMHCYPYRRDGKDTAVWLAEPGWFPTCTLPD